jgi:hypothetical protein
MVGYTALLMVEPNDGLGCVMLLNGQGDRLQTVGYALDAVGAAIRGQELPEATHPEDPTLVADGVDYEDVYVAGGREVRIEASRGGLVLIEGEIEAGLEREPLAGPTTDRDRFLVVHADLDRYPLVFRRQEGRVVETVHGPAVLRRRGQAAPAEAETPEGWNAFEGVYRSNDPWSPVLRVFVRAGRLHLFWPLDGDESELTPLDGGWFAAGDPSLPRRVRFVGDADGRAIVAEFNGGRWYRSNEP